MITNIVVNAKNDRTNLVQYHRHRQKIEDFGKKGSGLYLRKTVKCYGLF